MGTHITLEEAIRRARAGEQVGDIAGRIAEELASGKEAE